MIKYPKLSNFGATLKFIKNAILIKMSLNFLHSIKTCTYIFIKENYKNGEFSPFQFWQI